ncbi:DUF1853 family protein [Gramella sp. MAR_2010_147]|uniref:DUF1853 family protein n=1 Tax=Gramella sp. MAR_2010_147 TaxID=1250205 RepID=UPI00087DD1FE|nr:DUF1853 family protein [Gramella sp. MAR_2010_147]SDR76375.1 hypothetical protein SAMN04488553_0596 [Gramella sp. MAR_2010_147]
MKELSILNQFQGFLKTPNIFPKDHPADFNIFNFPEVPITDALIADLEKLDHPRNSVLGKRMESFFEIAIKHSSQYQILDSNIQIIHNKQTLGELDFLLLDKQASKVLHVELVYKLYIYDETVDLEIQRWIGPNRRDSFFEKLGKLRSRQFPLLYKPETLNYLDKLNISIDKIEQQLCFKAQLFTSGSVFQKKQNLVNPDCLAGNWYHLNHFIKMKWDENLFYSPKKKDWSCDPEDNTNWMNQKDFLKNIQSLLEKNKAPLVWMKTRSAFYKFFIVWW